jgi:hypothetical protein
MQRMLCMSRMLWVWWVNMNDPIGVGLVLSAKVSGVRSWVPQCLLKEKDLLKEKGKQKMHREEVLLDVLDWTY